VDTDRLADLAEHLRATEERPVNPRVSTYLGEAAAVADDAVRAPPDVARERVEQVRSLLAEVETTGDEEADEYVDRAEALAAALLAEEN
jgi:hypothetical protein